MEPFAEEDSDDDGLRFKSQEHRTPSRPAEYLETGHRALVTRHARNRPILTKFHYWSPPRAHLHRVDAHQGHLEEGALVERKSVA